MEPLPMIPSCNLDEPGLRSQRDRYTQIGRAARIVERTDHALVVQIDREVDPGLVTETLATERECCPFFTLSWDAGRYRLLVSVTDAQHQPALDAIAYALAAHEST